MKPKVFVTRRIPDVGLQLLRKYCDVRVYPKDEIIPRKELLKGVRWADALLCLLTDKIDWEVIDANPRLKIIANFAVGFNNIDVAYATKKGIPVTNTPGVLENAVAEHTFALLMALAKRIVEADRFMKAKKYRGWSPSLFLGIELEGKTLGIVGLGRIGTAVAKRAGRGMGMKVLYTDVKRNPLFEKEFQARFVSLPTLLKESDMVTLHVPLLRTTQHLIGKRELGMMKESAYLINTSRGAVVDEKALVEALRKKKIAGAGLDVYEFEPKMVAGLEKFPNVVLTPHTASATIEARTAMAMIAAKNVVAILAGHQAAHTVNPEVYKSWRWKK